MCIRDSNIPLGLAVAVLPWMAEGATTPFAATCALLGILVAIASLARGIVKESYGTWDRWVI